MAVTDVIVNQNHKIPIMKVSRETIRLQPLLKKRNPRMVGAPTSTALGKTYAAPHAYHCGLANEMIVHMITPKKGRKKHTGTHGKIAPSSRMARTDTKRLLSARPPADAVFVDRCARRPPALLLFQIRTAATRAASGTA